MSWFGGSPNQEQARDDADVEILRKWIEHNRWGGLFEMDEEGGSSLVRLLAKETGQPIQVNSGFRTREQQEALVRADELADAVLDAGIDGCALGPNAQDTMIGRAALRRAVQSYQSTRSTPTQED